MIHTTELFRYDISDGTRYENGSRPFLPLRRHRVIARFLLSVSALCPLMSKPILRCVWIICVVVLPFV